MMCNMLPLIKRMQIISGFEYSIEVDFDFETSKMHFTATRHNEIFQLCISSS